MCFPRFDVVLGLTAPVITILGELAGIALLQISHVSGPSAPSSTAGDDPHDAVSFMRTGPRSSPSWPGARFLSRIR